MYFSSSVVVAILAGIAQAQTPQGFKPEVKNKLDVMFNSTMVSKPGQLLSKAETASAPQIAASSSMVDSSKSYVFVMLDLDVPAAQGNATRRVLLHAMETGFKPTSQKIAGNAVLLASTEKGPASYIPPGPPATDTIPHRYVQMLFEQPQTLAVQASDFANMQARINFDITSFAEKNKLGEPMAANFFTVDGKATAAGGKGGAKGTASASGAMPSRTAAPFTGAAGQLDVSYGLAGLLGGLALVAV
ncbi:PEBP-like protein [Periconia macrospinosa]|uniref:PEBP-like protein n=1 Tax=Periconia macrospinosa TaxID=97972 RepID=A0A2V1DM56_9PLEO|nr:PEBP-like protein [Periconia macrospinosa]